jgi:hypothetical protein
LHFAKQYLEAEAKSKVDRKPDGTVPSEDIEIPTDSPLDAELHTLSSNALVVPLIDQTEAKAKKWIKSKSSVDRLNGVAILAHFKSNENIDLLKSRLVDAEVQSSIEGMNTIRRYPVRAAALAALKAWKVPANAVVAETVAVSMP